MNTHPMFSILMIAATMTAANAYSADHILFETTTPDRLREYWYNQGAEISRYALQQARYGGIHDGDAIWTMIRIAPQTLPQGTFSMIPGTVYARLVHRPLKPQKAVAALKMIEGNALVRYEINFPTERRTLRIDLEKAFPHRIQK